MLNKQELVQKVHERELPFELWETLNNQIYTRLCDDTDSLRNVYFTKLDNEYLIMDCLLPNQNYFFLSNIRLGSYYNNSLKSCVLEMIDDLDDDYMDCNNPDFANPTDIFKVNLYNKEFILFEIDSLTPSRWIYACLWLVIRFNFDGKIGY